MRLPSDQETTGPRPDDAASTPSLLARVTGFLPKGPKLQFLNLFIFYVVVNLTLDFPNPVHYVATAVGVAAVLDGLVSRWRFGGWRIPWPSMVAALGASMLIDGFGIVPFLLLPVLMVASKHLIRFRGRHLFNPNNFAVSILILLTFVRIGVNDWGAAPQAVALMLFFGITATTRVDRLDLAVSYLAMSFLAYWAIAAYQGWSLATVWMFALSPVQVMIGFFAITDPATSPSGRVEKYVWAALIVLLGIPATLAGRVEAPVFALLVAAPQRHVVTWLVRGRLPPVPGGAPKPAAAAVPEPVAPEPGPVSTGATGGDAE